MRLAAAIAAGALCSAATAADQPLTLSRTATLAQLFSANEAASLEKTLPADRPLQFRLREPGDGARGVLVYISPTDSGELAPGWAPVLDRERLLYIAADGFGNSRPVAERILAALGALRMARTLGSLDEKRRYIAGMSGGGRVASQVITHFPRYFSGALCIVGADYFMPEDEASRSQVGSRRMVFLTGNRDFNQREMQLVARRYRQAGVASVLLIDRPGFGHELPPPDEFARAIDFLDGTVQ